MMVVSPHRSCRRGRGSSGRRAGPGCGGWGVWSASLPRALGRSRRTLSRAGMPGGGRNVMDGPPWGVMAGSPNMMVKGSAVLCRIAFTRWVNSDMMNPTLELVQIQGLTGSLPCF